MAYARHFLLTKYSESLIDIIEHFDDETSEEALDLPIKDSTTLSKKRAKEIQRSSKNNLKATNSVLDTIIEPRAELSSISSHATASRRLMRSMSHIDDEALKKLIGKAAEAHTDIVDYLRQEKSQRNNVDMITPPGSPRPSTSSKSLRTSSQKKLIENKLRAEVKSTTGNGNDNELVAVEGPFVDTEASLSPQRKVLLVTEEVTEEEYLTSSDEDMKNEPSITDQTNEKETCSNAPDPNDDEEQILLLDSPTMESWGTDEN